MGELISKLLEFEPNVHPRTGRTLKCHSGGVRTSWPCCWEELLLDLWPYC